MRSIDNFCPSSIIIHTTHFAGIGIGNNLSMQTFLKSVLLMATNIEKLVHPLTWSSILPKNSRFVDSRPFNEDKSSLNTTTKEIFIQCGWKIVDHGLNWSLE